MDTIWQDLRYGARMLLKAPGFTAIAVLSLALGIGANTALFSVVDVLLLKKLPVKEPDRLVLFKSLAGPNFSPGNFTGTNSRDAATGQTVRTSFLYQTFVRLREQESALSDVFAFGNVGLNVNAGGQAEVASGQAVSGNYYSGLGVQPFLGRTITDDDDKAGSSPVAVLSHRYWQLNLRSVEPGFNPRNLLLFAVDPGLIGYKDERLANLYKQMAERLEALPGVSSITFSRMPLLSQGSSDRSMYLPGASVGEDGKVKSNGPCYIHQVRENFLDAMEIPLLAGRYLEYRDDERAPKVAVVNQTFAKRYFPDEDPVGKRFSFDSNTKPGVVEIIGLARDTKYSRQRDEVPLTAYLPWLQELGSLGTVTFEVRTTGEPNASVAAIRSAVRDVESNLPLNSIRTQIEQADETLAMERLFAKLVGLFGLLAQQLAAIGLYGVLAWSVSQRTHEIGIRMALGASQKEVSKMILKQGMTLTLVGLALGLVGAFALTKYLTSLTDMLYGVTATDPLTFGVIAGLLMLVALVACYIPARRATKVDPMVALRYE